MSKVIRKTAQLFGVSAGATGVEEFASKQTTGTLVYSIDPSDLQTAAWSLGWVASIYQGTFAPYYQDRNAVDLVIFYQLAYLLQQGIAEWDASTTYFEDSIVQSGGSVYLSIVDSNLNNMPPVGASNSYWSLCAFPTTSYPKRPTRTVLTYGNGTYTPPTGFKRIFVRMVGGGGGGGGGGNRTLTNNDGGPGGPGTDTTFGSAVASGGGGGQGSKNSGSPFTSAGGVGGAATGGSLNIYGGSGLGFYNNLSNLGMYGGNSKFGGAGSGFYAVANGTNASPNSGSGGGGGNGGIGGVYVGPGAGGGSGGYVELSIYSPSSVSYSVGTGGAGGSPAAGGSAGSGGAGGSGIIIIDELYY